MEEKIALEDFLKEMTLIIKKKFEKYDSELIGIKSLLHEVQNGNNGKDIIENVQSRVSRVENFVRDLQSKRKLDKSVLKVLEGQE
ncbi:MAG TPA: hypothetical protein VJH34_01615 [archaeon]|nr:hypothetical protein [archaeon]